VITHINVQKFTIRATRDKETYLITRYGLGKAEVDSIMKYIGKAEEKFENNWVQYE
jgi:hypothetical protein